MAKGVEELLDKENENEKGKNGDARGLDEAEVKRDRPSLARGARASPVRDSTPPAARSMRCTIHRAA